MVVAPQLIIQIHSSHEHIVEVYCQWTQNRPACAILVLSLHAFCLGGISIGRQDCDWLVILPNTYRDVIFLSYFRFPSLLEPLLRRRFQAWRKALPVGTQRSTCIDTTPIEIQKEVYTGKEIVTVDMVVSAGR